MIKRIFVCLFLLFSMTGCIETIALSTLSTVYVVEQEKTLKETLKDTKITASLTEKLLTKNKSKRFSKINFNVYKGRVLFFGWTQDEKAMEALKQITWNIDGVKEIMDEVEVGEKNKRSLIVDSLIASQVKTKLFLDKKVKAVDVNVEVYGGKVFIFGSQETESAVRRAARITSTVRGVKKVISYLRAEDNERV